MRHEHLREVALHAREILGGTCAQHVQAIHLGEYVELREILTNRRVVDQPAFAGNPDVLLHRAGADRAGRLRRTLGDEVPDSSVEVVRNRAGDRDAEVPTTATADRGPLKRQRRVGHRPPVVQPTDHHVAVHARLGDEHLVEHRPAGHLAQRTNLHTRLVHVEREERDPLMLGQIEVGTGKQHPAIGPLTPRGPHLLPSDDVLVTVEFRSALHARKVRSRVRLAEQLAPGDLPQEDLADQRLLLRLGAVDGDRGRDERDAHPERGPDTTSLGER